MFEGLEEDTIINELIRQCGERERLFRRAAEVLHKSDPELAGSLEKYARQSAFFKDELMPFCDARSQFCGDPIMPAIEYQGWTESNDSRGILTECVVAEESLIKSFESALKEDLPYTMEEMLMRHISEMRISIRHLEKIMQSLFPSADSIKH